MDTKTKVDVFDKFWIELENYLNEQIEDTITDYTEKTKNESSEDALWNAAREDVVSQVLSEVEGIKPLYDLVEFLIEDKMWINKDNMFLKYEKQEKGSV